MSRQKSSSNLALILARIRRLEDGRIDGFVLIRLPGAVALAILFASLASIYDVALLKELGLKDLFTQE